MGDEFKKIKTKLKADYVLRYNSIILSLVEAKAEGEILEEHLSQLQNYAKKLDVLISYISNDKEILCYDRRDLSIKKVTKYLSPDELFQIYSEFNKINNNNKNNPNKFPNYIHADIKLRSYQEVAIKKVVEEISRGQKKHF